MFPKIELQNSWGGGALRSNAVFVLFARKWLHILSHIQTCSGVSAPAMLPLKPAQYETHLRLLFSMCISSRSTRSCFGATGNLSANKSVFCRQSSKMRCRKDTSESNGYRKKPNEKKLSACVGMPLSISQQ